MCKVSVIIPNYNHSKYLPKRIESVLNQTFTDFELLIMDDFSSDDSRQIILEYADKDRRIDILFNDKNSGNTFAQWEKGTLNTRGEYIWFAESDDFSDKDLLASLVRALDDNKNVGVAYAQSWNINERDEIIGSYKNWTRDLDSWRWERDFINKGKDELKNYFCIKNTIPNASAALVRRSIVEKMGTIETSMKLCGDKMFWTKILLNSDIAFIAKHLNYFRTHSNNVRTKSSSRTNLIENFIWFSYLTKHVNVPERKLRFARERHYKWWVSLIVANPSKFFSKENMQVLKAAQKADAFSFFRLLTYLFNYYYSRVEFRMTKRKVYA